MIESWWVAFTQASAIEQIKIVVSVLGLASLIGIVGALISMRVAACNQIYSRWQSLLFKFADIDDAYKSLAGTYIKNATTRPKAHFIAVAYLNLFEEAYRYRHARLVLIWHILPKPFWISIVKSMRKQFKSYLYLRTLWDAEQDSFSADFNRFIRKQVLNDEVSLLSRVGARVAIGWRWCGTALSFLKTSKK